MCRWTIDVGWTSTWVRILNELLAACLYGKYLAKTHISPYTFYWNLSMYGCVCIFLSFHFEENVRTSLRIWKRVRFPEHIAQRVTTLTKNEEKPTNKLTRHDLIKRLLVFRHVFIFSINWYRIPWSKHMLELGIYIRGVRLCSPAFLGQVVDNVIVWHCGGHYILQDMFLECYITHSSNEFI